MVTTKEEFTAACQALGKNDPRHTHLNLAEYGSLLDRKRIQQVVQALEKNTYVEELTLSPNLCVNSTLQLSHFLKPSPSLQRLEMRGEKQSTNEGKSKAIINASIAFESISRSSLLVKLTLRDVLLGDNCPLEGLLSSTRTLLELYYIQRDSTMTYQVAQAIGSGLAQNKSLVELHWITNKGVEFLEEVLFGLYDHVSLKTLKLGVQLTKTSGQALRSLLHFNETLENLVLTQREDHEKIPTMVSVLAGLAKSTGLKEFSLETDWNETNATLATAWTNMLQRNASIKILDLRKADCGESSDADCELYSAVAKGLVENSALETLYLPATDNSIVLHGPVWQEMLESNHCLKKLCISECSFSLEAFECLARGLSRNTSLEYLDLSRTKMTDTSVIALVDGLGTNKTLQCLNLSDNCALSQSGRAAIERLIGYNVLRELILAGTEESIGASILTSGLSLFLRGNTALRHLDVMQNDVRLDGVCVTALKLDTMSLETLDLSDNSVTSCGIAALAQSLRGPCTLKVLNFCCCDLDDTGLLKLGEALTTNISLEVLDVRYNIFTNNGGCQFFELLPEMKGLKVFDGLMAKIDDAPATEAVEMALLDGLRKNTKLQHIFLNDDRDAGRTNIEYYFPSAVARKISFYLALNRHGRMLLRPPIGSEAPSGLWPRVLAKITGPRNMSLLFYFLQNKPKIVSWNAPQ